METLTTIVRELRHLGLTQDQIATELNVSQVYVSHLEQGKRGGRTPATTLMRAISARDRIRERHATATS